MGIGGWGSRLQGGGSHFKSKSLPDAEHSSLSCKHMLVLNCFLCDGWGGWKSEVSGCELGETAALWPSGWGRQCATSCGRLQPALVRW